MNDLMDEVAQDMRQERLKQIWRQYGMYIIAGVAAIILFVAGRQGLVAYQESSRNAAADAYYEALSTAGGQGLADIAADGSEGYPMLARFQNAAAAAEEGDLDTAEAIYLGLAGDEGISAVYQDAAVVLSVMNAPENRSAADLDLRLEPVASSQRGWAMMALEIQIGLALEMNNVERARNLVLRMRENFEMPADVNRRLQLIEAAIGE